MLGCSHLLLPFNSSSQHVQFTFQCPAHAGLAGNILQSWGFMALQMLGEARSSLPRQGEGKAPLFCCWVTLTPALPCCSCSPHASLSFPQRFLTCQPLTHISLASTRSWSWALRRDLPSAKLSFPFVQAWQDTRPGSAAPPALHPLLWSPSSAQRSCRGQNCTGTG